MRRYALTVLLAIVTFGCLTAAAGCAGDPSDGETGEACGAMHVTRGCSTDTDCFRNMCTESVCVDGYCEDNDSRAGAVCIQYSTATSNHIAGHCMQCACVDDITRQAEGPSS